MCAQRGTLRALIAFRGEPARGRAAIALARRLSRAMERFKGQGWADWRTSAILFAAFHNPNLLMRPDWSAFCQDCRNRGANLGVGRLVAEAIEAVETEEYA